MRGSETRRGHLLARAEAAHPRRQMNGGKPLTVWFLASTLARVRRAIGRASWSSVRRIRVASRDVGAWRSCLHYLYMIADGSPQRTLDAPVYQDTNMMAVLHGIPVSLSLGGSPAGDSMQNALILDLDCVNVQVRFGAVVRARGRVCVAVRASVVTMPEAKLKHAARCRSVVRLGLLAAMVMLHRVRRRLRRCVLIGIHHAWAERDDRPSRECGFSDAVVTFIQITRWWYIRLCARGAYSKTVREY